MKALFLGTLAASQAMPIIEFIPADIRTEILDNNEPAQAAAALADTDVLLTGGWRRGFPAAPKLGLLQGRNPLAIAYLPGRGWPRKSREQPHALAKSRAAYALGLAAVDEYAQASRGVP